MCYNSRCRARGATVAQEAYTFKAPGSNPGAPTKCSATMFDNTYVHMASQRTKPTSKKNHMMMRIKNAFHQHENLRFWKDFFEIERIASMELHEDEALVVTTRNHITGEEKIYPSVRLKHTLKNTRN